MQLNQFFNVLKAFIRLSISPATDEFAYSEKTLEQPITKLLCGRDIIQLFGTQQ